MKMPTALFRSEFIAFARGLFLHVDGYLVVVTLVLYCGARPPMVFRLSITVTSARTQNCPSELCCACGYPPTHLPGWGLVTQLPAMVSRHLACVPVLQSGTG